MFEYINSESSEGGRQSGETFFWQSSKLRGCFDDPTMRTEETVTTGMYGMVRSLGYRLSEALFSFLLGVWLPVFPCLKTVEKLTEEKDRNIFPW